MRRRVAISVALTAVIAAAGCGGGPAPASAALLEQAGVPGEPVAPASAGGEVPTVPSANEECGTDRRCRIARLRRRGARRTAAHTRAAEAEHAEMQQAIDRVEHDRVVRRRHPWLMENVITDHWLGAIAGFHPMPNFFVGIGGAMVFGVGSSQMSADGMSAFYTSASPLLVVDIEARWLVLEHNITPYVSGGFHVMALGSVTANGYDMSSSFFQQSNIEVHAMSVGLGIDLQLDFGLRFRVGAVMRPLIYVRARNGMDTVPEAEEGFRGGWRLFGAEGAVGWSW